VSAATDATTRLRFERREWKYLIRRSNIDLVVPELLRWMDLDDHSTSGPYNVYSVYFDNPEWGAFTEKLDGVQFRKKFRIRSYYANPAPEDKVLVEVKEKRNDIIVKRRTAVEVGLLSDLVAGRNVKPGDEVIDEWRFHLLRNGLRPRVLVAYDRLALKPRGVGEHRVTLDKNVKYAFVHRPDAFGAPLRDANVSRLHAILEIKFAAQLPAFLGNMTRSSNLTNEAISKYCDSIITNYKLA